MWHLEMSRQKDNLDMMVDLNIIHMSVIVIPFRIRITYLKSAAMHLPLSRPMG